LLAGNSAFNENGQVYNDFTKRKHCVSSHGYQLARSSGLGNNVLVLISCLC
jgi:hypothetical protein